MLLTILFFFSEYSGRLEMSSKL